MKTTSTNNLNMCPQLKELSRYELLMVKISIGLLGLVLNICCLQLFL